MQNLTKQIASNCGLSPETAEKAVGILLNLLATQGDKAKVAELFAKVPGAAEAVIKHGGDGAGGAGLMGILAGGMMGGPLAMITKLQAIGLSVEQMKAVGAATLDHLKAKGGVELVRAAAANIPGINSYI